METAEFDAYQNQARTRRNRSRRKGLGAQMSYFDILFCEAVICIVFAVILLALRYLSLDYYNRVSDCISVYQSLSIGEIITAVTEILKNALL